MVVTGWIPESYSAFRNDLGKLLSVSTQVDTMYVEFTVSQKTLQSVSKTILALCKRNKRTLTIYYVVSPCDMTTIAPGVIRLTAHASGKWDKAMRALKAYSASPKTFSELSNSDLMNCELVSNQDMVKIINQYFPGTSVKLLDSVMLTIAAVVESTLIKMADIKENFGHMLDIYTKNVGLMVANQIEQILRMFSVKTHCKPALYVVFLEGSTDWVRCFIKVLKQVSASLLSGGNPLWKPPQHFSFTFLCAFIVEPHTLTLTISSSASNGGAATRGSTSLAVSAAHTDPPGDKQRALLQTPQRGCLSCQRR